MAYPRNRDHYHNRRDVLRETLRRLNTHLAYSGPRALVIADDGSDDGTAEMLAEYPDAVHGQPAARPGGERQRRRAGRARSRRLCAPAPGRHAPAHDARHAPAY